MAKKAVTIAERREPLNRERVLSTALRLADEGGIEALTMRRLAQELGVEAMSLYHYVADKDEILAGILDLVMGEIELPPDGGDWKEGVRKTASSYHAALARHRWAHSVMTSPSPIPPRSAQFRYMEALLGRLRKAGFSARMTHHAYHALDSHIIGTALWEAGIAAAIGQGRFQQVAQSVLQRLPPEEYPYFHEHAQQHLTRATRGDKSPFEFGLDLILDGLDALRDGTGAQRRRSLRP